METYGYVRVSSKDQNEDRQLIAIRELNVEPDHVFIDKQSGKDFCRPEYLKLMEMISPGDLIYVKSIDRLGRDYEEIQNQWRIITKEKKANIAVIDMPLLDTRKEKDLVGIFLSDSILQLLSFIAENERQNIRQRQAEGIAAAKAKGVTFGRPRIKEPDNFEDIYMKWKQKMITPREAAYLAGMSLSAFYARTRQRKQCPDTRGDF